jgi:hypothetical protein
MEKLYHYTIIKNANVSILESIIRDDAIHLHAAFFRKYFKEDYQWIKNYSKEVVKEICEGKKWQYDEDDLTIKPYLISFCLDSNSSYMWTNYADYGKGMKLIFDKKFLLNCSHGIPDGHGNYYDALETALPCIYIDDKRNLKQQLLDNINHPNLKPWDYFDRLKFLVASIKQSKPYKEEQEFRFIHLDSKVGTFFYNEGNPYYQDDEGPIIADEMWVDILFPKEMLLGIELGNNATNDDLQYVRKHIKSIGYDPRIVKVTSHKFK